MQTPASGLLGPAPGSSLAESPRVPWRVLVVDDNPGDARYIGFLLDGGPYLCAVATSYEEAVELIRQHSYDVYLIDYRLGNRTGLDLIEDLSGATNGPFILVTGFDDPALDDLALSAGASDYLSKGQLTVEGVTRSIRYAVETWRARRAAEIDKERFQVLYERQRESQAEAQRLGDLARAVLEALQYPQAVISFDGQIIAANSAWRDLISQAGILPEDGDVGANYVALCRRGLAPEGFDGAVVVGIEDVLTGRLQRFRHKYSTHYGGSDRWFRIDVTPVPGTGAVLAHSDVTEERKARNALEELIRAKDEFIASVSHELRTPTDGSGRAYPGTLPGKGQTRRGLGVAGAHRPASSGGFRHRRRPAGRSKGKRGHHHCEGNIFQCSQGVAGGDRSLAARWGHGDRPERSQRGATGSRRPGPGETDSAQPCCQCHQVRRLAYRDRRLGDRSRADRRRPDQGVRDPH